MMAVVRWLGKNLGSLALAFFLAVVVWVSAVTSSDPNAEQLYPRPLNIAQIGLDPGLLVMGAVPSQATVTLNAPKSIWTRLTSSDNTLRAWVDLSGLSAGQHKVRVQVKPNLPNLAPVRVVTVDPEEITFNLEPLLTQTISVTLRVNGEPALGYRAGDPLLKQKQVTVSGAESIVSKVKAVRTILDITNSSHTVETTLPLQPLDANGNVVNGVTITPATIDVTEPISLLGGYRNVIVKVITQGQVASGYKLTNIIVTPPNLIVFSQDPQLVNDLPGYVETKPLDLTGAQDYIETMLDLNLPKGISAVNYQRVLVQVSVAPIESNVTISLPVEVIGTAPGLTADVAPGTVDVILSGPLPVLSDLKPSDLRVIVDITNKVVGVYTIAPQMNVLPARLQVESILPASLEVVIRIAPTPTPQRTPLPTSTAKP
jgi:YbbR domain-containing protein